MGKKEIETVIESSADNGGSLVFGVDKDNNLYVNDKLVVTESKIKLDTWVNIAIIISAVATLGSFLITLIDLCS